MLNKNLNNYRTCVLFSGSHTCHAFVLVTNSHVDYLVDHASLHVVPDDPNWKTEANTRINALRKSDLTIKLASFDIYEVP